MQNYDVIVIGAGPGGIFSAYELVKLNPALKIAVFEAGHALNKRKCPIDGEKIKSCIQCKSCSIMSGFGGAGAFSDGKYNITNDFGGTLYEYVGKRKATELIRQLVLRGVERLKNLFKGSRSRSEIVATFLAVLELCKINSVKLDDDVDLDDPNVRLLDGSNVQIEEAT